MLAVLEEDRVAGCRVVARHPETHADLEADGHSAHQLGAVGVGLLSGGKRGGHNAGTGVEHGREMRVVVVEGMRVHAVDEGGERGRQPVGQADRRCMGSTAVLQHP